MPTYLAATRDYYMEDMIFLLEPQSWQQSWWISIDRAQINEVPVIVV